jgi:transcription elongation factor B subunit 1
MDTHTHIRENRANMRDIMYSGVVLEKVCEYFCYNEKNKEQSNVADMDIPPELCLELLMAADYLDT